MHRQNCQSTKKPDALSPRANCDSAALLLRLEPLGLAICLWGRVGQASNLHRATVKSKLHSRHSRVRENAEYGIGIEDFQTQISARRHDFRGACGLKIDGITRLFPRLDGASGSFASDVISIRDKAAAELFGKLSKADFIGFLDKNFAALVLVCRPGAGQIESVCLRS